MLRIKPDNQSSQKKGKKGSHTYILDTTRPVNYIFYVHINKNAIFYYHFKLNICIHTLCTTIVAVENALNHKQT